MFKMIKTLNENRKLQQKVQILEKKVEGQKKFNAAQKAQNQKLKTTATQAVKDKAWYQNEYIVEKHARQALEVAFEGQKKHVSKHHKKLNEVIEENERLKRFNELLQNKINEASESKELTEKQISMVNAALAEVLKEAENEEAERFQASYVSKVSAGGIMHLLNKKISEVK